MFRTKEEFTQHLVESMASLIDVDVASYGEINSLEKTFYFEMAPLSFPVLPNALEMFWNHAHIDHPVLNSLRRIQYQKIAYRNSDIVSVAQLRTWAMYPDFYVPNKTRFLMHRNLHGTLPNYSPITLARNHKDFSDRDLHVLSVVGPHLERAHANSLRASTLKNVLNGYAEGLSDINQPIVAVDACGHIVWATKAALDCVSRYGKVSKHGHQVLPSPFLEWVQQQAQWLEDPESALKADQQLMIHQGDCSLTVRLVFKGPHRLLFMDERIPAPSIEGLRHYGLTTREREVAGWVIRGKSNAEIARILGISQETVHRHLSGIYQKLRIDNRTAILAKAHHSTKHWQMH